jgi:hypothetical protein
MQIFYRAVMLLAGMGLTAFCGSTLGYRIGLNSGEQWPIIGFALGILLLSQIGVWTLQTRVKALEDKTSTRRAD